MTKVLINMLPLFAENTTDKVALNETDKNN